MYENVVKDLRHCVEAPERRGCVEGCAIGKEHPLNYLCISELMTEAADAIETLEEYVSRIQSLPDCNTCLKKKACEFAPRPGQMCRINCPHYLGDKGEAQHDPDT